MFLNTFTALLHFVVENFENILQSLLECKEKGLQWPSVKTVFRKPDEKQLWEMMKLNDESRDEIHEAVYERRYY